MVDRLTVLVVCLALMASPVLGGQQGTGGLSLNLATIPSFKPFVWKDKDTLRGIDVDIVREMCRRMDLSCHIELVPWRRVLSRIASGRSDGGFSGFRTPERSAYAIFLDHPLHFSTYSVFVAAGREFDFSSVPDLYGRTVGINRGFVVNTQFNEAVDRGWIKVQYVDSLEQNLRKLLAGNRIDAVIANYQKVKIKIAELGMGYRISCLPNPIVPPKPAYLMISKKWQPPRRKEILKMMNQTLKAMYDEGVIDNINASYLN